MHRRGSCTGCDCRGSKTHRDLTVYDVEVAGCVSVGSICVHAKKQEAYKGPLPYAIVKEDDGAWGFAPGPGLPPLQAPVALRTVRGRILQSGCLSLIDLSSQGHGLLPTAVKAAY